MDRVVGSPFDLRPRREATSLHFVWVFPYAPVPAGRSLPMVRAWLELPGLGPWEVPLAFDSAADLSPSDGGGAVFRGFDPTAGTHRVVAIRGVSGTGMASVHPVTCIIEPPDDPVRLALDVGFTDPESSPPPLNVLGRQGFLDRFGVALRNDLLPPCLYLAPRSAIEAPPGRARAQ